jgi:DNA repair protein RecO (recombination protein O)
MHTLSLELAERQGADLLSLRSSSIATARCNLTADLDRMQTAGRALRWLRNALPQRTPEPETWIEINRLLDALDQPADSPSPSVLVAEFGITLIGSLGFALNLVQCVGCSRCCEPTRSAFVDVNRGGIVCRRCGSGGLLLPGSPRARLIAAASGTRGGMVDGDALVTLDLVDSVLRAHLGIESTPLTDSSPSPSNHPLPKTRD